MAEYDVKCRTVFSVQALEEDDENVCAYNIAVYEERKRADSLVELIQIQVDDAIDGMEDTNEDYFTPEHCTSEYLALVLKNANLKEGIQVRNCSYKIYVTEETLYV